MFIQDFILKKLLLKINTKKKKIKKKIRERERYIVALTLNIIDNYYVLINK